MDIYLEDCSNLWAEYIRDAFRSVVVFTPFFDEWFTTLFDQTDVPYEDIWLVTQLDWVDDRPENKRRVALMKQLLIKGVNVQVIDRLHAKILVVDWEYAFFGSQNFTRYSTGSIEISSLVYREENKELFSQLKALLDQSHEVTLDDLMAAVGFIPRLD